MNCTDIKKKILKSTKPEKKPMFYVEEGGKTKKMVSTALFWVNTIRNYYFL